MTLWHAGVMRLLRESGLFVSVQLSGGKVRAMLSETRFVDIHFDPTSRSYSYALIDLTLTDPGDKRILGWDDYPYPGLPDLAKLASSPHHFQERLTDGSWMFAESTFRGEIENELAVVLAVINEYLCKTGV
jgi:hypothetical protein